MLSSAFFHLPWLKKLSQIGTLFFTFGIWLTSPSTAAERVNLKIGIFEKSITIKELKQFAQTRQLSSNLRPYSFILNAEVQKALQKKIMLILF